MSSEMNPAEDFDRIHSAGFVNNQPLEPDNLPTAMEAEVYVDGKLQIKNKKNKGKKGDKESLAEKKKKEMQQSRNFSEICSIFRVLWATRQTEDVNKDTDSDRYTKVTLRELVVYVVFLVILCIIAFGMISTLTYQFSNVLIDAFVTSQTADNPPLTFATVNQMADIWKILEGPFLDNLYTDWYTTDDNHTQDLSKYVSNENRVLGLSRLRQVRVLNNSCVVPSDFATEIKFCYSDWAPSVEDKNPYGAYYSLNDTNVTAWYFQSESQLGGSSYQGLMNNYAGGGYVLDLSQNKNVSMDLILYLFQNLWIDRGTRAVFVDFTVYNANINMFGQVKLVFELPATGGVTPSYVVRSVKLIRYVNSWDYFVFACEIMFCIYVAYYIVEEIIEIHKHRLNYFKTFWNDLDIMIIALAIICIIFNIYRQVKVNDLLENLLANDQQYVDFDFLCYWQIVFNSTIAFMVFLAWIKVFKYVSFNKTMTQLSLTLSRCAKDVTGFAIMFFIVFLAYAQLGFLIFGTQIKDYSTFSETIFSLFRLVLGDFDFDAMEQANRVLGPIFFLTYVFFVFFVLLNMFIAIINDTYGEIKMEIASQKSDIELAAFFKKGYINLLDKLNLKRAHIVDIHQAVTSADLNQDKKIDFIEWRNNLRNKGYGDVEIETLFAKYDIDGDRCLNETEQMEMIKDLADQNKELREAYKLVNAQEQTKKDTDDVKKRKRGDGVTFEDYHLLSQRIDKMEASIGGITNKIDSVLNKLEDIDRAKHDRSALGSARKSNLGSSSDMRRSRNQGEIDSKQTPQSRNKEPTTFSMMVESKINPINNSSDC